MVLPQAHLADGCESAIVLARQSALSKQSSVATVPAAMMGTPVKIISKTKAVTSILADTTINLSRCLVSLFLDRFRGILSGTEA